MYTIVIVIIMIIQFIQLRNRSIHRTTIVSIYITIVLLNFSVFRFIGNRPKPKNFGNRKFQNKPKNRNISVTEKDLYNEASHQPLSIGMSESCSFFIFVLIRARTYENTPFLKNGHLFRGQQHTETLN